MWYCFGLAICTGASSNAILDYNLVRFGVCMIKLRHERMHPSSQKTELSRAKKLPPPPRPPPPLPKNSITITETISIKHSN